MISVSYTHLDVYKRQGCATAKGYHLKDGTSLTLSEKDQKWLGIAETFKFK